MTSRPAAPNDPVASAAGEALLAARWECAELLSRRPSLLAADLLRGHAAELATSALASDQVLSLALETAAGDIEAGNPPLDDGARFLFTDTAAGARQSIRGMVLAQSGEPAPTAVDVVVEVESRLADQRLTPAELSRRLAAEARLQEALWDDPRIPAQVPVRQAMLCSIPKLAERAAELDHDRSAARQDVTTHVAKMVPAKASTAASLLRWSSQHAGWLLAIGLLVVALVALIAPIAA